MELNLTNRQYAQIKRIAQNVDANYQKRNKVLAKMAELNAVIEGLDFEINEMEAPVMRITGGLKSTDIYEKQVVPQFEENGTPKLDKNGRQVKVTKYVLKDLSTVGMEENNEVNENTNSSEDFIPEHLTTISE